MSGRPPIAEQVAQRILYSADAAALLGPVDVMPADASIVAHTEPQESANTASQQQANAWTLAVFDERLPDLDSLVADITAQAEAGVQIEYLVLDADSDGLQAVTEALTGSDQQYQSVQIYTHGAAGSFELGNQSVSNTTLPALAEQFASWRPLLSTDADLLIFGCDLTADGSGLALIDELSELTGADVAASNDTTGHESLGGDWELEDSTGLIESFTGLSTATTDNWLGTLNFGDNPRTEQVNQSTAGNQHVSEATGANQIATNGQSVVVVWESDQNNQVYFRLYDTNGQPTGNATEIARSGSTERSNPVVAMNASGQFIVVWEAEDQDGDNNGLYAQRFAADGTPMARPSLALSAGKSGAVYENPYEFRISRETKDDQRTPAVALFDNGRFIITWVQEEGGDDDQILYATFDDQGNQELNSDQLASTNDNRQYETPVVAINNTTQTAVIAFVKDPGTGTPDLELAKIGSNGLVDTVKLNVHSHGFLARPAIAMNDNGAIVVAWQEGFLDNAMYFKRLDANLDQIGSDTEYFQSFDKYQSSPSIALDASGNIVVAWDSIPAFTSDSDVYVRHFNAAGVAISDPQRINVSSHRLQSNPQIVLHGTTSTVFYSGKSDADTQGVLLANSAFEPVSLNFDFPGGQFTVEGGNSVDFRVALSSQPTADVTITATISDPTEGTLSQATLNVTSGNWSAWQTFSVTPVEDGIIDGDIIYNITFSTAGSTDVNYQAMPDVVIPWTNRDNDSTVGAVTDSNASDAKLPENATAGTQTSITAQATDPDPDDTVTYQLISNPGNRFVIDASSGVVSVSNTASFDFENDDSHQVKIRASSTDGSFSEAFFVVSISNVPEPLSPVTDANTADANAIAENASAGTAVGLTAYAIDGDEETVSYSLTDDAGGRFAVDANTGVVTYTGNTPLQFEGVGSYQITVAATSPDDSTQQDFTIAVTDANDPVSAITDTDITEPNSVTENAGAGTLTGITAYAEDEDAGETVEYSLLDDAGGRFVIDVATGVVTVSGNTPIDYEAAQQHDIEVRAQSSGSPSDYSDRVFTINVLDANDPVSAISDADNATVNRIAENAAAGTTVGVTAAALDQDGDSVTYSLIDNAGDRFIIDANTGIITVSGNTPINFEDADTHDVTVEARSSDGSSTTKIFTISVTDIDESVGPISDADASPNTVAENSPAGTLALITAMAQDPEGETITYTLDDNAGNRFAIDGSTGVVSVVAAASLDFEAAQQHQIQVRATSTDGSFTTATFTISIANVNESVSAIADIDGTSNLIPETATGGTSVGISALAIDPDDGDTISYSLTSNPGNRFEIVDPADGTVTVNQAGSFTWTPGDDYMIVVRATSSDGTFTERTFTISVTNVNDDISAIIDANAGVDAISEDAAANTPVGITASATDPDAGDTVTYSISSNPGNLFKIADDTVGVVTVNDGASFNYENATEHTIRIRADSSDGSYSERDFTVQINNVNEPLSAIIDDDGATNSVNENASQGTLVGITAHTSDADLGQSITYTMESDPSGLFAIDGTTGVVSVATGAEINYEAPNGTQHQIQIRATSSDGSTVTRTFDIDVTNVNEPLSAIVDTDSDDANNQVLENSAAGTTVGITAHATDTDSGRTITYSLEPGSDSAFVIDANTGVVSVDSGATINYESSAQRFITVRASSDDGSTATRIFSIDVIDVNEGLSAIADLDGAANSIAENSVAGTATGITARATDTDQGRTITYSLDPDSSPLFGIDANTGVVTVSNGANIDFETSESHQITVRATSNDGSTITRTFNVAVTNVNEGLNPIIDSDATPDAVAENAVAGTPVGITVQTTDTDNGRIITYELNSNPDALFAIDANTGVVTVSDAAVFDFETDLPHQINVLARSSDGSTIQRSFTIAVSDVNEAPSSNGNTRTIDESTSAALTVADFAFADQDAYDTLSAVRIDTLPTLGTLSLNGTGVAVGQEISQASLTAGELVFTPVEHGVGSPYASFRFQVADSAGLFSTSGALLTFNVINTVDYSPTITSNNGGDSASITLPDRTTAVTTVRANDPDSPTLFYTIAGGTDAAAFNINNTSGALSFRFLPTADNPMDADGDNIYHVLVSASDGVRADTQSLRVGVAVNPDGLTAQWSGNRQIMEDQTSPWGQSLNFADPLNASVLELNLAVSSGSLSLRQTTGLTFTQGDGVADQSMRLSGSVSDIAAALLTLDYRPDQDVNGNWAAQASFIDPNDPTRSVTISTTIEIIAVNDSPSPAGSMWTSAEPGTERVLSTAVLSATDIEDDASELHFVVLNTPSQGSLLLDGVKLNTGDRFTQQQLSEGKVSYLADKATGSNDSFEIQIEDSEGGRSGVIKVGIESLQPSIVPDEPAEAPDNEVADDSATDNDDADGDDDADDEINNDGRADTPGGDSDNASGRAQAALVEDSASDGQSPIERNAQSALLAGRREIPPAVQGLSDNQESERRFDLPVDQLQTERSYGIEQVDFSSEYFSRQLQSIKDEIQAQTSFDRQIVTSSFALSSTLSIGYVLWLIRSGALLSSVLATMPAWRSIDPLPVLSNMPVAEGGTGDDESIESMLEQARQQAADDSPADAPDLASDSPRATL